MHNGDSSRALESMPATKPEPAGAGFPNGRVLDLSAMRMFGVIRRCKQLKLAAAVQTVATLVWAAVLQGVAGPEAWVAASAVVMPALALRGAHTFAIGLVLAGMAGTVAQATGQLWLTAAVWPQLWVVTVLGFAANCAAALTEARALAGLAACSEFEVEEMRKAAAEQRLPQPDAAPSASPSSREFRPIVV